MKTSAIDFLTPKTIFLYPLLKYAYEMTFDEVPNYQKLIFNFKKILLDRDYIPEQRFDWSLLPGEQFAKVNPNDKHSSISSCDINSYEQVVDYESKAQMMANIIKQSTEYARTTKLNHMLL